MSEVKNSERDETLERVWQIDRRINELLEQSNTLQEPIALDMIDQIRTAKPHQRSTFIAKARLLPPGFYRSEVLTAINVHLSPNGGDDCK